MKQAYLTPAREELLWSGHLYDYSGYAKANREVIFRLERHVNIQTTSEDLIEELKTVEPETSLRLDSFFKARVSKTAALLRFYVPLLEKGNRYKICYTMMETAETHPEFVRRLNGYYNEVWVPTLWNKQAFVNSGVRIPCHVVPLGIDPDVYCPGSSSQLPTCELVSTKAAGLMEIPSGFHFISIFQPTFRKGLVVALRAFQAAFGDASSVNLILGSTAHGFNDEFRRQVQQNCPSAKVYLMSGKFTERDMAGIYRSTHAYVSTSLGEGWNLPLTEAAACGLPCIVPKHTAHLQYADESCAYMVPPDDCGPIYGSGGICTWYGGMPFFLMNDKATSVVSGHMRDIHDNYRDAMLKARQLMLRLRTTYTWDETAKIALERLKGIWK